jgi:UDP-2,4-diacetamido-2,4,6-trideoxy-beta-L-altropyranose hydrolase
MNPGTLLLRADASAAIGSGHVMRCLALAQGWQSSGGQVVFAMAQSTTAIDQRLAEGKCRVLQIAAASGSSQDCVAMRKIAIDESPSWIVLDGYALGSKYRQALEETGRRCLIVDDNGGIESFSCDLVLNQNLHASEDMYPERGPRPRLLLGPRYALLRDEFVAYRGWSRRIPEKANRILITMGGSDPTHFTPRALSSLLGLRDREMEIRVAIGGSVEHASAVEQAAAPFGDRVKLLRDVRNMAEQMAWADLAIAGAGTTCWELCLLGLPAVLIAVASNQEPIARSLASAGAAVHAGIAGEIDCAVLVEDVEDILLSAAKRSAMARAARSLVDGWGRERVLDAMRVGDGVCV